jgi:hypothetical protein
MAAMDDIPEIRYRHPAIATRLTALLRDKRITWRDAWIGLCLASFANSDGETWPGRKTLAKMTGVEPNHISEAIASLAKVSFLTIKRTFGKGNRYRLTDPKTGPVLNQDPSQNRTGPVLKKDPIQYMNNILTSNRQNHRKR